MSDAQQTSSSTPRWRHDPPCPNGGFTEALSDAWRPNSPEEIIEMVQEARGG